MLFPITRANPAKFVLAEAADDVIATSRLLDTARAHWTILCLRRDVVGGFRVVAAFLQPDFDGRALGWVMKIEAALVTEVCCARLTLERGFPMLLGVTDDTRTRFGDDFSSDITMTEQSGPGQKRTPG